MGKGKRILLLGVYGMEMVECGGVICKNAKADGTSHVSVLFAGPRMQEALGPSAETLGCTIEYLNMDVGTISASVEEKKQVIKVIRSFKPDIIITQDPEHCIGDLDPGRRPAMTLLLEAMALAGRRIWLDEEAGTEPHRGFTVYYMTPEHPNCLVDILEVWDEKCHAMDLLESQLEFIGELSDTPEQRATWSRFIPGVEEMDLLEYGTKIKRIMDQAYHMYYGSNGHNKVLLSENYRKESLFVLDQLM
ncbi:MAG: LmbE-like protein [Lachnospiraceae bacterium]|nr:LmbE-like protein [Lachnospiraceae bacterium]